MKDRETLFIDTLKKSGATWGIGDDGVVLDSLVYAADSFVEGSHFKREWFSLEELAYKALAVNVSDLYAMNATPRYALLTLSLPRDFSPEQTRRLSLAIARACDEFKIKLIGGDTILASLLGISFTLIGSLGSKPLVRKGVKPGDILAYTGKIGESLKDLRRLMRGFSLAPTSRFIRPVLRPKLISALAPLAHAGMDISDGLFLELERLSTLNRVGFEFRRAIPRAIGCSGEEYEMLFAFPPRFLQKAQSIAKQHRVALNVFARATKGGIYRAPCKGHHC